MTTAMMFDDWWGVLKVKRPSFYTHFIGCMLWDSMTAWECDRVFDRIDNF